MRRSVLYRVSFQFNRFLSYTQKKKKNNFVGKLQFAHSFRPLSKFVLDQFRITFVAYQLGYSVLDMYLHDTKYFNTHKTYRSFLSIHTNYIRIILCNQ